MTPTHRTEPRATDHSLRLYDLIWFIIRYAYVSLINIHAVSAVKHVIYNATPERTKQCKQNFGGM